MNAWFVVMNAWFVVMNAWIVVMIVLLGIGALTWTGTTCGAS
jgi:hypothetical protein